MARILVTGGAGFVGSNLVHSLLNRGDEVVVLDDFSTGRRENIASVLSQIRLVDGSLADQRAVDEALDGVTAVLHQGALPSVPKSVQMPIETNEANIVGTLTLLESCRRHGVSRVVYAASSSAYGDHSADIKDESLEVRPKSPYAIQKLTGEMYCRVYTELFELPTVALRYFNVFGPRQNPKSQYAAVVPAFVTRMLKGQSPIVYGDGLQSRDFTFIENVIQANFAALSAPLDACGRVYNVGYGHNTSLLELIANINDILGTEIVPEHRAERPGDVRHSCASIDAARNHLGYEPTISVIEGLKQSISWYAASEGSN